MPNGKPGDHPLTDIIIHGLPVYSRKADALVPKGWSASALLGRFRAWWCPLAFGPFFWRMVLVKGITLFCHSELCPEQSRRGSEESGRLRSFALLRVTA